MSLTSEELTSEQHPFSVTFIMIFTICNMPLHRCILILLINQIIHWDKIAQEISAYLCL